jgi:hypothetical protein
MCNDLAEFGAREFERRADELVAAHKRGQVVVTSPIFNGPVAIEDIPKLKRLNRAALYARAWFLRHGPSTLQPLPLSDLERINCFISERLLLHFVGMYSLSLQGRDYDFLTHPLFFDYCRGIMGTFSSVHDYLRNDPDLQKEFPERPLSGLDQFGRWRPKMDRAGRQFEDIFVSNHLRWG